MSKLLKMLFFGFVFFIGHFQTEAATKTENLEHTKELLNQILSRHSLADIDENKIRESIRTIDLVLNSIQFSTNGGYIDPKDNRFPANNGWIWTGRQYERIYYSLDLKKYFHEYSNYDPRSRDDIIIDPRHGGDDFHEYSNYGPRKSDDIIDPRHGGD